MSPDGSPSPSPPSPPSPHGTREPRPAARWEDAFLSGNGRHGAMVFGYPYDDRVVVTHHTLVRPNGGEHAGPPELSAQLPQFQNRLLAGDLTAAEEFTDGRAPQWVQPLHPAFQMRLRRPADGERGYRRSVDFTTGVAESACTGRRSRVLVSRVDAAHTLPALIVETLIQSTPDRLVLLPALPALPAAFPEGELRGVRTRFGAEVDIGRSPAGARAVVRPTRTHRVDLRTSPGARPLDLRAGEDRVLTLGPR